MGLSLTDSSGAVGALALSTNAVARLWPTGATNWVHIAWVFDQSADLLRLYTNGVLVLTNDMRGASHTGSLASVNQANTAPGYNWDWGNYNNSGIHANAGGMSGMWYDDFRVYNFGLGALPSTTQMLALAGQGSSGATEQLTNYIWTVASPTVLEASNATWTISASNYRPMALVSMSTASTNWSVELSTDQTSSWTAVAMTLQSQINSAAYVYSGTATNAASTNAAWRMRLNSALQTVYGFGLGRW
jgi:hypothetical protein